MLQLNEYKNDEIDECLLDEIQAGNHLFKIKKD